MVGVKARDWTDEEVEALRKAALAGLTATQIGRLIGRGPKGIYAKSRALGLILRVSTVKQNSRRRADLLS